jgi:hypothetical protein
MKHRSLQFCAALLLLLSISLSWAAEEAPKTKPSEGYTATINNRELMHFRSNIFTYTPQDRAQGAELRIRRMLPNLQEGKVDSVLVNSPEMGISVTIDGQQAFLVLQGDVDTLAGDTLESTANKANTGKPRAARPEKADPFGGVCLAGDGDFCGNYFWPFQIAGDFAESWSALYQPPHCAHRQKHHRNQFFFTQSRAALGH